MDKTGVIKGEKDALFWVWKHKIGIKRSERHKDTRM